MPGIDWPQLLVQFCPVQVLAAQELSGAGGAVALQAPPQRDWPLLHWPQLLQAEQAVYSSADPWRVLPQEAGTASPDSSPLGAVVKKEYSEEILAGSEVLSLLPLIQKEVARVPRSITVIRELNPF